MKSFLAIRLTALSAFLFAATVSNRSVFSIFSRWDASWYARIARRGYGTVITTHDGRSLHDYAFFPLLPLLERLLHDFTSLSYVTSGLCVSVIASLIAVVGIERIGKLYFPEYVKALVILWALLPLSAVLWMSYSESLFTALATWSLYFALRERWFFTGLSALLAGLTRPIGIALAFALLLHAVVDIRQRKRLHSLIAVLLAPLGTLLYFCFVSSHSHAHSLFAYFRFQAGWGNGFDAGKSLFSFAFNGTLRGLLVLIAIAAILWLSYALVRAKLPFLLTSYALTIVAISLSTAGYFSSKPRYLLPAFILLAPIAQWAAKLTPKSQRWLTALALIASVAASAVFLLGSVAP